MNTSLELNSSCRLESLERACTKMKTSGHKEEFIRKAVVKGLESFMEKKRKSGLPTDHPEFQPLYCNAGWRRNRKAKTKAMKRSNWYKEGGKPTGKDGIGGSKKRIFQKAVKSRMTSSTVVFVPSTKGGLLIGKLKEREDRMRELTGFRI
jgi:hypothetical protein